MIYKSYLVEENISLINKTISLFYGENLGLKNDFKNKIKVNNKNAEVISFTQEEILKNEKSFFNEVLNISLFEKEKIYFINDANDKIFDLLNELQEKPLDQKIFIFSNILDKRSKLRNYFENSKTKSIIACYSDDELSIKKIILKKLYGYEGLSIQNINLIIDCTNLSRDKLYNELDKIVSYFTNKRIENDKLEKLLNTKINDDFNLLKDQALNGNKIQTNKLLSDTVITSEKNLFFLSLINQRLHKLLEIIKQSQNKYFDEAINSIKPPIFWKDKPSFLIQTKKWNFFKIKKILTKTYNLEIQIKSNSIIEKNLLIKKLLVDICILANS